MAPGSAQNRFTFIAPMFNAGATVEQMLLSVAAQSYSSWRIILIDDVSDAAHVSAEAEAIQRVSSMPRCRGKIDVVWNVEKRWEVSNVLRGASMCDDDDIVCRIDADDWLTDCDALSYINAVYNATGAGALWTAHRWGFTDRNISGAMPPGSDPYRHPWVSSHLKTFRRRLLTGVPYENFLNMDGELVRRAGDQAIYLPVLHRCPIRGFVPRVMYHYTIDEHGGAVYESADARFQKAEADYIRSRGYVSCGSTWEQVLVNDNA